jgi:hypothetical protein
MSTDNDRLITDFFELYAARFNQALADPPVEDVEGTARAFADYFVGARPAGVMGGPNDARLREVIPQGNAFYRSVGTKAMAIRGIDVTTIDDLHAMARVHWESSHVKPDGGEVNIPFDVVYLLQMLDGVPRIFAYITGDEQGVLRAHGLLPPS